MTNQPTIKKYVSFATENEALNYAKENRLTCIVGKTNEIYHVGNWDEPMMRTIYKPHYDGNRLNTEWKP